MEDAPSSSQSRENIVAFMQAVKPFNLTKNECLMIVNDPPTSALHIQLQVEDSEERLTEDQVNAVLEIVRKWLMIPVATSE